MLHNYIQQNNSANADVECKVYKYGIFKKRRW